MKKHERITFDELANRLTFSDEIKAGYQLRHHYSITDLPKGMSATIGLEAAIWAAKARAAAKVNLVSIKKREAA